MRFIILLFATLIFAKDYVQLYRLNGEKMLINALETTLQNKAYWLNKLKDKNVSLGYYESPKDILVCVKKRKILKVYKFLNRNFKKVDSIKVLTGLDGDKQREGDLKTPIGVYRLTSFLTNVDPFYGPFAFETGYPNLFDKIRDKDGHGIWIHGVPLRGKRDSNNTKGCIVMKNDRLKKLKEEINLNDTYLLISEKKPFLSTKSEIASILAFIYKWRYAWKTSDFDKYKKFYDKTFKRFDGKDLKEFLAYKKRVFENKKNQNVSIIFKNINIIPYQNISNQRIFRINMYEIYSSDDFKYRGNKELYVKLDKDGIKILTEK